LRYGIDQVNKNPWWEGNPTRGTPTMTDNDIEYGHKTIKAPSETLRKDIRTFFQGSSVTKQATPFSIAQVVQDLVRGLLR